MLLGVFVDEAAEALAALELADRSWVDEVETRRWCGRFQFERAVRPVGVVVLDVDAQHTLALSSARDQQPIEAVAADRADPAFGEGVRVGCPIPGADDLDALGPEDFVERAAELAVAVPDQEPHRPRALRE
jgi:hypothetical protein